MSGWQLVLLPLERDTVTTACEEELSMEACSTFYVQASATTRVKLKHYHNKELSCAVKNI